jgi:hypothetical protein
MIRCDINGLSKLVQIDEESIVFEGDGLQPVHNPSIQRGFSR